MFHTQTISLEFNITSFTISYFELPLIRTIFHFPTKFEIKGSNCNSTLVAVIILACLHACHHSIGSSTKFLSLPTNSSNMFYVTCLTKTTSQVPNVLGPSIPVGHVHNFPSRYKISNTSPQELKHEQIPHQNSRGNEHCWNWVIRLTKLIHAWWPQTILHYK